MKKKLRRNLRVHRGGDAVRVIALFTVTIISIFRMGAGSAL